MVGCNADARTAVLLTLRDSFFDREHYQQLVYSALPVEFQCRRLHLLPPCIVKPRARWSGKQARDVLSVVYSSG